MNAELSTDIRPNGRYNKSQTARLLGCSRTTLDKIIAEGKIKTFLWQDKLYIKGITIMKYFNA